MPASGCFGPQLGALIDLDRLGALVTKTVFFRARPGNRGPRVFDVPGGMMNSVGIPSLGAVGFLEKILPTYTRFAPPTIVSIGGLSITEYVEITEALASAEDIDALEVNVSCPNLEAGGLEIGANPERVERVVRGVVDRARIPVFVKLTPNVTSIADIARAAEAGGADAVTAINTVVAAVFERGTGHSALGSASGGLSGPAIKPIALRAVRECVRAVSIPVIGAGGIASAADAIEFFESGAIAIQIGTATFTRPDTLIRVIDELEGKYLAEPDAASES
jgi:dihydroorotate dehydrogenase (NAD+) catalytic subunit